MGLLNETKIWEYDFWRIFKISLLNEYWNFKIYLKKDYFQLTSSFKLSVKGLFSSKTLDLIKPFGQVILGKQTSSFGSIISARPRKEDSVGIPEKGQYESDIFVQSHDKVLH